MNPGSKYKVQEPQETHMDVMLCTMAGISAVFLILLVVVCVRCSLTSSRPPPHKPGSILHLPTVTWDCQELDRPRPQLLEGYCQVVDAVNIKVQTPTSPPYAEVDLLFRQKQTHSSPTKELPSLSPVSRDNFQVNRSDGLQDQKVAVLYATVCKQKTPRNTAKHPGQHQVLTEEHPGCTTDNHVHTPDDTGDDHRTDIGPLILEVVPRASNARNTNCRSSEIDICHRDGATRPRQQSYPSIQMNTFTSPFILPSRAPDSSHHSQRSSIGSAFFYHTAPKKPPRLFASSSCVEQGFQSSSSTTSHHVQEPTTLPLRGVRRAQLNATNAATVTNSSMVKHSRVCLSAPLSPSSLKRFPAGIVKNGIKLFECKS